MGRELKQVISSWDDEVQRMIGLIVEKYGQPDEMTDSELTWHNNGPWVMTKVTKTPTQHSFPMPHTDFVEQFINYKVPVEKVSELVKYDGSVTYKRTEGLLSARCHDEEANFLALNLAHDIVTDKKSVAEARNAYVQNMKDFRAGKDVPYMQELQFDPKSRSDTADKDVELVSKEELDEIEAKS